MTRKRRGVDTNNDLMYVIAVKGKVDLKWYEKHEEFGVEK